MISQQTWRSVFYTYVDDVLSGKRVAGEKVKNACRRHVDDVARSQSSDWPYRFDDHRAASVCQFVSLLTLSCGEYAGTTFDVKPFQCFILGSIFGWVHKETGHRRYRDAFVSMGRGNGKSPLAAAIMLYMLAFDCPPEPEAQCISVATKADQAKIVFNDCRRFVDQSIYLQRRIQRWQHRLYVEENGSSAEAVPSDAKGLHGRRPHLVVIDELHAWSDYHEDTREAITTSLAKRTQSLCLVVTTAGSEKSEVWRKEADMASLVVDQTSAVDSESLFVFIADIDDDDDPMDESCWIKANPMLEYGIVKLEPIRAMAAKVQAVPSMLHQLMRFHCNRFITSYRKALDRGTWANGNAELPDLEGAPCYVGLDLGSRRDLSALALVFPLGVIDDDEYSQRYAVQVDAWCAREGERDLNRTPWTNWIQDGYLRVTDGDATDIEAIWQRLVELMDVYSVQSIALDPWNARQFATKCETELGLQVYEFPQSNRRYHEPLLELNHAVEDGRLIHGGNPLLAWCVENMVVKYDAANYGMPYKDRSQDKIDPVVATLMALGECMYQQREAYQCYYDNHELESF